MVAITEGPDAAAGADTLYSMQSGDKFVGTNPGGDHDWVKLFLEPGYHYRLELIAPDEDGDPVGVSPVEDYVRLRDDDGDTVEFDTTFDSLAQVEVDLAGTYYLDVSGVRFGTSGDADNPYSLYLWEFSHKRLKGTSGSDDLFGGSGQDSIDGYKGKDTLIGGDGDDRLNGGKSADRIEGGSGADDLRGGMGRDVFVFKDVDDSSLDARGEDSISDFRHSDDDKINLRWIDAKEGKAKNNAFTFIGTDDFSGRHGELRAEQGDRNTFVYGDVDGDGSPDSTITIRAQIELVADDFV